MRYVGLTPLRKQPYGTSLLIVVAGSNEGVVVSNEGVVVSNEGVIVSNEGVVMLNEVAFNEVAFNDCGGEYIVVNGFTCNSGGNTNDISFWIAGTGAVCMTGICIGTGTGTGAGAGTCMTGICMI